MFNQRHPDKNVWHQYILDLIQEIPEIESMCKECSKNATILTETAQVEILGHFAT